MPPLSVTIRFRPLLALFFALIVSVRAQDTNTAPAPAAPLPLSPVIWTENPDVVHRFAVNSAETQAMLDRALLKLTSASDVGTAWKRLGITSEDVVGIKITTMGGPLLSSHRSLVEAICAGLRAAGVPSSHIIVWDKDGSDMRNAGYAPSAPSGDQVGVAAIFPGSGYDRNVLYKNGLIGTLIWGDSEFVRSNNDLLQSVQSAVSKKGFQDSGSSSFGPVPAGDSLTTGGAIPQSSSVSAYARLVTTTCTKIINVPVLIDNSNIGINGCLGSLALGSVDNNRRFQGPPSYGDPCISEILQNDVLRRKVVLHIMDALVAQYAGGPRFDPQFSHAIGALYVSRDPVAIDSIALKRLEGWRRADRNGRIDPIDKAAAHVHGAATANLGTDDPSRIQLIKIP